MTQTTSRKGIDWLIKEIKKASNDVNYNAFNPAKEPFIGGMFFFTYSAKYAETLPYWDKLPLVIPFDILPDGFIGINLHYVSREDKRRLFSLLSKIKTKKTQREYVKITYSIIKSLSKTTVFEKGIHRYLSSHIKSRLVKVNMEEWENVAALPLAKWTFGRE